MVTLVMAAAYLPIGAFRKQLGDPRVLALETGGVLGFGALAMGALAADGRLAQYLLAAAWLGHAAWDFVHHRADRVVPRWCAEICAILDALVAVGILLPVPHLYFKGRLTREWRRHRSSRRPTITGACPWQGRSRRP